MLSYLRGDPSTPVAIQNTEFTSDVLGRFVCNTLDEAIGAGGRPFDAVVIGAGMFGAYAAEKLYREGNDLGLRILVLDAGSYLLPTHAQNLPHLGFTPPEVALVTDNAGDPGARNGVWGIPWHSNEPFTGLAYCPAGRSLFWGGWAPRMTEADLANWPQAARDYLNANYGSVEEEIGVTPTADYLKGDLNDKLMASLQASINAGSVAPNVAFSAVREAPLAVQAEAPASGLFSFDKYSSAPILMEAVRDDIRRRWTAGDDSRRRLFLVPRAHVIRLITTGDTVSGIELTYNGQRYILHASAELASDCQFVIAAGTIESTRLALESFPLARRDYAIGANFAAHLRTNCTVRVKRSALGLAAVQTLEQGGCIVRGEVTTSGGAKRRIHFQVLATSAPGSNPEATMWAMVPDIDLLNNLLMNQSPDWITLVLRGLGEMESDVLSGPGSVTSFVTLTNDGDPNQLDENGARRAWVNFTPTAGDMEVWRAQARAAVVLAARMGAANEVQFFYNNQWNNVPPADPFAVTKDRLGNTHHEAGTLWMGDSPTTSITDANGKFHHIRNAFAVGPSVFRSVGSANPSLTGLTLARATVEAVHAALTPQTSATLKHLYNGTLNGWQQAGDGGFLQVFDILETQGGPGLLWHTREVFGDFRLELEFQYSDRTDNSGVFIRIPELNGSASGDWLPAVEHGYEIQIDPRGVNAKTGAEGDPLSSTGAIYQLSPPTRTDVTRGPWVWNTMAIEAIGNRITVTINDVLVNDFTDANPRTLKGHVALQNHHAGSKVQFRNIRVKGPESSVVTMTRVRRTAA
jgi:choline dehydrogenase-like flavoprotein